MGQRKSRSTCTHKSEYGFNSVVEFGVGVEVERAENGDGG